MDRQQRKKIQAILKKEIRVQDISYSAIDEQLGKGSSNYRLNSHYVSIKSLMQIAEILSIEIGVKKTYKIFKGSEILEVIE